MKRHGLDLLSLTFGVVFALLGGMFLAPGADPSTVVRAWPVVVVVTGVALILVGARLALPHRSAAPEEPSISEQEDADTI